MAERRKSGQAPLKRWLSEATDSFPEGVRARLTQEYTAHYDEGGGGDVVAVFGQPATVRRSLGKVYVSGKHWRSLQRRAGAGFWVIPVVCLLWGMVLWPDPTMLSVSGSGWLLIWGLTRPLPTVRRNAWRASLGAAPLLMPMLLSLLLDRLREHRFGSFEALMLVLLVGSLAVSVLLAVQEDARLRRTLDLQTASPEDEEAPLTSPRSPAAALSPRSRPRRSLLDRRGRSRAPAPTRPD